jgi:carbon storage regulator
MPLLNRKSNESPLSAELIRQGEAHMLCLSRKPNETIHIGNEITVTILSINGQQIRLGIDAPKDIPVMREEVLEREASAAQRQASKITDTQDENAMNVTPHNHAAGMAFAPNEPIYKLEDNIPPEKPKPKITFKRRKIPPNPSKT